jgi:hypothetical protein
VRTYLNCPFAEKDEAKALGARWDGTKKRWYVQDVKDLAPFQRWIAEEGAASARPRAAAAVRQDTAPGVRTGPAEVAHCGCDVLPWEPCVHTPFG